MKSILMAFVVLLSTLVVASCSRAPSAQRTHGPGDVVADGVTSSGAEGVASARSERVTAIGAQTGTSAAALAALDEMSLFREKARQILDAKCGKCHNGALLTAVPAALAVFDLTQEDWSAPMSDTQLLEAGKRIGAPSDTMKDREAPPDDSVSADARAFQDFIRLELDRRKRAKVEGVPDSGPS